MVPRSPWTRPSQDLEDPPLDADKDRVDGEDRAAAAALAAAAREPGGGFGIRGGEGGRVRGAGESEVVHR